MQTPTVSASLRHGITTDTSTTSSSDVVPARSPSNPYEAEFIALPAHVQTACSHCRVSNERRSPTAEEEEFSNRENVCLRQTQIRQSCVRLCTQSYTCAFDVGENGGSISVD